jgi:hypothetical protein
MQGMIARQKNNGPVAPIWIRLRLRRYPVPELLTGRVHIGPARHRSVSAHSPASLVIAGQGYKSNGQKLAGLYCARRHFLH